MGLPVSAGCGSRKVRLRKPADCIVSPYGVRDVRSLRFDPISGLPRLVWNRRPSHRNDFPSRAEYAVQL